MDKTAEEIVACSRTCSAVKMELGAGHVARRDDDKCDKMNNEMASKRMTQHKVAG